MKLYLKNIGKIEEAFIEMNDITVIAGENVRGKVLWDGLYLLYSMDLLIFKLR